MLARNSIGFTIVTLLDDVLVLEFSSARKSELNITGGGCKSRKTHHRRSTLLLMIYLYKPVYKNTHNLKTQKLYVVRNF